MSQKVLTFNLMLSTSKSLIDSALAKKSTKELITDPRFKNLGNFKFFTLANNKNLLSFEYEFSKSEGCIFKLEFLDYDGFFEYNLISSNINDFIVGKLNKEKIRLDKDANPNPFSNYYIAFGTTTDFKDWSGPFSVYLGKTEYEFTIEATKKVLLTFFEQEGPSAGSKLAKMTTSDSLFKKKFETTPFAYMIESRYEKIKQLPSFEDDLFNNKVLPSIISDYISAYVDQESIILIPDMSLYKGYYDSLKSSRSSARGKPKSAIRRYLNEMEALPKFFQEFGLIFESYLRDFREAINTTLVDVNNEKEERRSLEDGWKHVLKLRITTSESQIGRGGSFTPFVDGYIPLQKLAEGFSKLINPKSTSPFILIQESDTNVLKIWKEFGLIKDDSKPVTVWGRSDYIYNNLYPKLKSFDDNTNLRSDLKIKFTEDYASKMDALYTQSYNSDFKEKLGNDVSKFGITNVGSVQINELNFRDLGIPVFKSNITNPNVLAYNFTNFKQNLGVLQSIIKAITDFAIQDSAGFVDYEVSIRSKAFVYDSDNLDKYLDRKSSSLYNRDLLKDVAKSLPLLIKNPNVGVTNTFRTLKTYFDNVTNTCKTNIENYRQFLKFQKDEKDKITKQAPELYASYFVSNNFENPIEMQQKINTLMSNQVVQMSIRTLPFFSFTGMKFLAHPCVFLQKLFNNWISPLSGVYSIFGIKHVANSEEMYSEFELTKEGLGSAQPVKLAGVKSEGTII